MSPDRAGELSAVSKRVLEAIERRSRLAWPILKTQCELKGLDPANLRQDDLPKLAPAIGAATARFTSPEKGKMLEEELLGVRTSSGSEAEWTKKLFSPEGAQLGPLSQEVLAILEEYTPLAWAMLEAQCERAGFDPAALEPEQLDTLTPKLQHAVARFSSDEKAGDVARKLGDLARRFAS